MKFKVVTYYGSDDEECNGDYYEIALFNEKGDKVIEYGDSYHSSGYEKMEGFIDGIKYCLGEHNIDIEKVKENLDWC